MTSEATRKASRDKARQEDIARKAAIDLKDAQAQADARGEAELALLGRTPPLARDEEHSFVQAEESEFTAEELQPNLTGVGVKGLEVEQPTVIVVGADGIDHEIPLTESRLEIMTDEEIADSGLLTTPIVRINPAMIAPTSERQRTPLQRAPAAGPGSWPVPEDQLPAVMPSDPPVEEGEEPGDATLSGYPPFKVEGRKVVVFSSEGARSEVEPDETKNAAALYLRLRNQFPHFTEAELSDEFIIQWEARVGAKQSFRPSQELSQHGDTAVGDPRVTLVELGAEREDATIAQPNSLPHDFPAASTPPTGLPSINEPASRAPDDEKELLESGELKAQDKADLLAVEQTKAFKESEETGEPLPEPPSKPEPSGASEAKGSGEKSEPSKESKQPEPKPAKPAPEPKKGS